MPGRQSNVLQEPVEIDVLHPDDILPPPPPPTDVKPEIGLRDQLDLDSMDFLDIVMELRKKYGIDVPEDEYPQLESLQSCADYLTPLFNSVKA